MAAGDSDRRWWAVLGAIVALGLALRILNAQGALWLDEVWSAMHAREAATPAGVFVGINHDNNHHLNSLWMQAVGIGAPPMIQRGLAIVSGTLAIPLAWLLCRRAGPMAATLAALLMAVLPFFVTYGSEARGYAPMIMALLVVMLRTDRWLADDAVPPPAGAIALWAVLGLLSQLTMAIGLAATGGWAAITLWRRHGLRRATMLSLRAYGPALVASALVVGGILLAAQLNAGGMRFGALIPFSLESFSVGFAALSAYSVGVPVGPAWPVLALPVLLAAGVALRVPRLAFHALALVGFPLAVLILQPANAVQARYYFIVAVAVLILGADLGARALERRGWQRIVAAASLAAVLVSSLVEDLRLIVNQRADTGRAIIAIAARRPGGATVLVDRESTIPVVALAGIARHYPVRVRQAPCPLAPFLFVDRYNQEGFEPVEHRCGHDYLPIAEQRAHGMTPAHWRLYIRR